MGTNLSKVWTDKELVELRFVTFLTIKEILTIFQHFRNLAPKAVDLDRNVRLPREVIYNFPGMRQNPFRDRICFAFCSASPNDGSMSFEDILDMMSVFNEKAPLTLKCHYAFLMYDFDEDGYIGYTDLKNVIRRWLDNKVFSESKVHLLIKGIMGQADLEEDGSLSYFEFEHAAQYDINFEFLFRYHV